MDHVCVAILASGFGKRPIVEGTSGETRNISTTSGHFIIIQPQYCSLAVCLLGKAPSMVAFVNVFPSSVPAIATRGLFRQWHAGRQYGVTGRLWERQTIEFHLLAGGTVHRHRTPVATRQLLQSESGPEMSQARYSIATHITIRALFPDVIFSFRLEMVWVRDYLSNQPLLAFSIITQI